MAIVGLCPTHFVLLGGYTSQGKSTFLSQLIINICEQKEGMLVFSCEDSKEDKMVRIMSALTDIGIKYIVKGEANEYRIEKAGTTFDAQNF